MGRQMHDRRRPRRCCSPTSSTRAGTRSPTAASPAATAPWSARPASAPRSRTSSDLAGARAERTRRWDSCFTLDFSYIHGGSVRAAPDSRYRQWMTHKLATWIDQFGTSGCVGCGRCITWCPVGIDITEEVAAPSATATRTGARPDIGDRRTSSRSSASIRSSPGLDGALRPADRRLRPRTSRFERRRVPVPRGRAGRPVLPDPPRPGRARDRRARARRGHVPDARRRRDRRRVLADPALPLDLDARALEAVRAIGVDASLPARQVRGRPRPRLRADEALRAGPGPSGCRRRACSCSTSTATMPERRRQRPSPADPMAAAASARVRARRRDELADVWTLDLDPGAERPRRFAPGPVQHALRLRRRRGGDLHQRRSRPTPGRLVHTIRAVGAVSAALARLEPRRRRSACAGRSAPAGRWRGGAGTRRA